MERKTLKYILFCDVDNLSIWFWRLGLVKEMPQAICSNLYPDLEDH